MVQITIKYFANIKEVTKIKEEIMEFNDGATINTLLESIFKKYNLKKIILDENDEINSYINILRNGRNIKYIDGKNSILSDKDVISFFPPVAGGAGG